MGPQVLGTGVYGPLLFGSLGLLLGRNSALMKGIRILPRVIGADYTGEIKIMVSVDRGVIVIPQGDRMAQLILLPQFNTDNPVRKFSRGNQDLAPLVLAPFGVPLWQSGPYWPYGMKARPSREYQKLEQTPQSLLRVLA